MKQLADVRMFIGFQFGFDFAFHNWAFYLLVQRKINLRGFRTVPKINGITQGRYRGDMRRYRDYTGMIVGLYRGDTGMIWGDSGIIPG